jgi:hypothetical protein
LLDLLSRVNGEILRQTIGNLMATEANHCAGQSGRLDRVDARLERIERHLGLADVLSEPLSIK